MPIALKYSVCFQVRSANDFMQIIGLFEGILPVSIEICTIKTNKNFIYLFWIFFVCFIFFILFFLWFHWCRSQWCHKMPQNIMERSGLDDITQKPVESLRKWRLNEFKNKIREFKKYSEIKYLHGLRLQRKILENLF